MGFFSKLAQLIKSNLNDLINQAEDPEKMLNQVILDMNQQLLEAKKQVAIAIADEKRLGKQAKGEQDTAAEWQNKAMMAVRAGDDELAKQALQRQREHESLAQQLGEQWTQQRTAVEQLKLALRALNDQIEEAKRKKNVLITRKRRAEAMRSIQETMSGLSDTSAFDTFNRMARDIEQLEAEAEAGAEVAGQYSGDVLSQKFRQLEHTAGAEADLAALKAHMGITQPKEANVAVRIDTTDAEEPLAEEPRVDGEAELDAALEALKKRELA